VSEPTLRERIEALMRAPTLGDLVAKERALAAADALEARLRETEAERDALRAELAKLREFDAERAKLRVMVECEDWPDGGLDEAP
jgi:hypothetical protein